MKQFVLLCFSAISLFSYSQNNAPIAVDDSVLYTYGQIHEEDTIKLDLFFKLNDTDPDGNTILVDRIIYNGTGKMIPFIRANQVFWITYIPESEFSGIETFDYIIKDNGSPVKYDTGTVVMTIMRKDYETLDANNVKATVSKDVLFSSPTRSFSGFIAPSGSNTSSIYAANLWITGNNNGSVHSNIRKFGYNPDSPFGTPYTSNSGPVSDISHTDSLYNTKWDRVWKIWQRQIDNHKEHWSDAGYSVPKELLEWPAHGIIVDGEAQFLAPYVDVNQDTLYNPYDGDYPIIKGDQAIYFIYNDGNSPISINPMISEVHGMAYAYYCHDSALQNTIFVDYRIYNRSANTYDSTFIGMWTDVDVGNAQDDYVQCDVNRNLFFGLNGDNFDDDFSGSFGYHDHPAAQGILLLKGAKQDDDGMDNNVGIGQNETINGTGFGDGITDNETWGMEFFTFFNNAINANPVNELEYSFIQSGRDYSGNVWAEDFNNNGTLIPYKYMLSDTSDPSFYGTGGIAIPPMTEAIQGNNPGDRRALATTGPITFKPGDMVELTYAFVFGRDYVNTGIQAGMENLLERVDSIQSYYDQGMLSACGFPLSVNSINETTPDFTIYPNPTNNTLNIKVDDEMELYNIELYDNLGRLLKKQNARGKMQVDVVSFSPGIYFLIIKNLDGLILQQKKIVIN